MASENASIDLASEISDVERDAEVASQVTATPSINKDGWQGHDMTYKAYFTKRSHHERKHLMNYGLTAILWVLSLAITAVIAAGIQPAPRFSYEAGFETDLGKKRNTFHLIV